MTLDVHGLTLTLPGGDTLCEGLSFSVARGEVLVLQGDSGSGKSSILNWMTGTLHPAIASRGEILLDGEPITGWATERRRLGLMLQRDFLFPHMSVADNLLFGLRGGDDEQRRRRVARCLVDVGLDGFGDRHPDTLSGGQRSRVSLMRTLLSEPRALLLDEPFSRLDRARRQQVREFVWQQASALPVVLVTHDADDIPPGARIELLGQAAIDSGDEH